MSYPKELTDIDNSISKRILYSLQGAKILNLINSDTFALTPVGNFLVRITNISEVFTIQYSQWINDFFNTVLLQKEDVIQGLQLIGNFRKKSDVISDIFQRLGYHPSLFHFRINSEIIEGVKIKKTFNMISSVKYCESD